jgi:N-acetylneuraminic acid mutarotase
MSPVSSADVTNIIIDCSWTPTGSLNNARFLHTATLLPNGKVLVAGGWSGTNDINGHPIYLTSAELYDPATGLWTFTGSLTGPRAGHTATLLPNGKVLVVGGSSSNLASTLLASSELFDPATGLWTSTGSLANTRSNHTATLLPNGKVLVAGGASTIGNGNNNASFPVSAELFDPSTGLWSLTGSLADGRVNHTATLLASGKVLVVGGNRTDVDINGNIISVYLAKAEVYDPTAGLWTPTGSLSYSVYSYTATLLQDGKVLVKGGGSDLYDPVTGLWVPTDTLGRGHSYPTATLLPDGKVLIAGGGNYSSSDLFDPVTGTSTPTGSFANGRRWHTATMPPNGKLLAVGGNNGSTALSSAELFY